MKRASIPIVGCFLAGSLAIATQPPKEPVQDSKSLGEWVKQLAADDAGARRKAEDSIRALATQGDAVCAALLAAASQPDNRSSAPAMMLAELGPRSAPTLVAGLWSPDDRTRRLCLLLIARMGPDVRTAAPTLTRLLADPDEETRRAAAGCLSDVGAHQAISHLVKSLDDRASSVRLITCESLMRLGADSKLLIDHLIQMIKSDKPEEVSYAVALLGLLGPEAAPAVPALVALIPRDDAELTARLAGTLAAIGPAAKEAIPAFKKRMATDKHKGHEIGQDVAVALWRVARDPDAEKMLRDQFASSLRPQQCAEVLRRIDAGKDTVAGLEELLKSERPDLAIAAASVLGTRSKDAVPLLGKMLVHKDSKVRASALIAIVRLGSQAKDLIEPLRVAAKDDNPTIAFGASALVCRLATSAEAVESLAVFLTNREANFRTSSADVLGLLGAKGKPAVAKLTTLLSDTEDEVRLAAAVALWRIEQHPLALSTATEKLRASRPRTREAAAVELGGVFGAEAKAAVPELVKRLFDPFSAVRSAAAEALGRIGPPATDAAPALIALLEGDEPSFVQSAACEALGLVQPADKEGAAAVLKKKLDHQDPLTRVHAALALWLVAADKAGEKAAEFGLGYRTYQARITSAEALWRMNQDTRAVPVLLRVLEDSNLDGSQSENERYMATRALGRMGSAAKPAVPELTKLLTHHDAALAATAAAAIKAIEQEAAKKPG